MPSELAKSQTLPKKSQPLPKNSQPLPKKSQPLPKIFQLPPPRKFLNPPPPENFSLNIPNIEFTFISLMMSYKIKYPKLNIGTVLYIINVSKI